MPLDLEEGDAELAEATPAQRRRAARQAADGNTATAKKPAARSRAAASQDRLETELASRLDRTFDRIAKTLEARDDIELADVIREDKDAMSQGLVSLTRSVKFLRSPLIMALNLVEPALAFGRITRVLYGRWADRQRRIATERQQQQQSEVTEPFAVTP